MFCDAKVVCVYGKGLKLNHTNSKTTIMADLITSTRKKGDIGKKKSTSVDLTPMVDLGFLLITFFIFSTTMAQPTALKMVVPKDVNDLKFKVKIKEKGAITFILDAGESFYYYEGLMNTTLFNLKKGTGSKLREEIINKKSSTNPADLFVIMKATNTANYNSVVNLLDEMVINDIKRYALVDITPVEELAIKNIKQ